LLRCILCRGRCRHAHVLSRRRGHCMAVMGIVLWSRLLCGRGGCCRAVLCCGRGCCAASPCVAPRASHCVWCHRRSTACGAAGIPLCVVSWVFHCVWCRGRFHHMWRRGHPTVCDAAGVPPHAISRSQLVHRTVLWPWWPSSQSSRLVVPSARRVVRERGDWTAREEISRKQKKRKKKYNAPAEGKLARVAW